MSQCVAACCRVLQCVASAAATERANIASLTHTTFNVLQSVAVCCGVLQYVAVCCRVLQSVASAVAIEGADIASLLHTTFNVFQCVAVCCSVLQSVAGCCGAVRVWSIIITWGFRIKREPDMQKETCEGVEVFCSVL